MCWTVFGSHSFMKIQKPTTTFKYYSLVSLHVYPILFIRSCTIAIRCSRARPYSTTSSFVAKAFLIRCRSAEITGEPHLVELLDIAVALGVGGISADNGMNTEQEPSCYALSFRCAFYTGMSSLGVQDEAKACHIQLHPTDQYSLLCRIPILCYPFTIKSSLVPPESEVESEESRI